MVEGPQLTSDEEKDKAILEQHQKQVQAFEKARTANLERGGVIEKTATAYGSQGEENGVVVRFSPSSIHGSDANVVQDIKPDGETGEFVYSALVS